MGVCLVKKANVGEDTWDQNDSYTNENESLFKNQIRQMGFKIGKNWKFENTDKFLTKYRIGMLIG